MAACVIVAVLSGLLRQKLGRIAKSLCFYSANLAILSLMVGIAIQVSPDTQLEVIQYISLAYILVAVVVDICLEVKWLRKLTWKELPADQDQEITVYFPPGFKILDYWLDRKHNQENLATENRLFTDFVSSLPIQDNDAIRGAANASGLDTNQCSICFEDLKAEDQVLVIKRCKHQFHSLCLRQWLQKRQTCPHDGQ